MSHRGYTRRTALVAGSAAATAALVPGFASAASTHTKGTGAAMSDMTGGKDPAFEYFITEKQTEPGMQEGFNWWLWDDQGRFGFPRCAVEAFAPDWDHPHIEMGFVTPEGQVSRQNVPAPRHKELGPDGKASHFGTGGLWFEVVEPFKHYRSGFSGAVLTGAWDEMLVPGYTTQKLAPMRFEIEAWPVVPPFIQGTLSAEARARMAKGGEALAMGGDRLEQLCRVKGVINWQGKDVEFTGGALRIRRKGVRKLEEFFGHAWQSAVFPSGKAFGYIAYPGYKSGKEYDYNEGFVYLGEGELIPARAVKSPWLKDFQYAGEDVSCVMETEDGRQFKFGGKTTGGVPSIPPPDSKFPPLHQMIAHYTFEGESAYGMIERSTMRDKMKMPG
jgi:hypothetical protein